MTTPATAPAGATPDTAVLLVNLGTPEAPTAAAVKRYLGEFLGDPYVVQIPRVFWWPLLHGVILPLRSPRVAKKYAEIWMEGGSPLAVHTRRLAGALQARLPGIAVDHAMRYGAPAIDTRLRELAAAGARRVLVLPLYPQYSSTTTGTVAAAVERSSGALPARVVHDYATDPGWVAAVADSIRTHWDRHGRGERLLFSFHGLPQRLVDAGDPYAAQCEASVAELARALDLAPADYVMTYQSRFGRERWLGPATDETLRALAEGGLRRIDVVCPGFAADCLETLEEIAMQNEELFREAGGQALHYIPCLNDAPAHADALAALALRELAEWSASS
ncbi:ferrochelatase [Luteimonas composti]|uniref:Ferrochelatase n=1 Tax=Luteimonas composti TaxID=398257 RepID=A0ABT6MNK2_9GAMM|nr:ferrochelatase [Luteimonas composti]MDH7452161.1 ferrochelatase [Luteimonas composti]